MSNILNRLSPRARYNLESLALFLGHVFVAICAFMVPVVVFAILRHLNLL